MSLETQYQLIAELEKNWENYNKDGKERKSKPEYFKAQWDRLEQLWSKIQCNHEQLCMEVSRLDEYFTNKVFEEATALHTEFRQSINQGYTRLTASNDDGKPKAEGSKQHGKDPSNNEEKKHTGSLSKLDESLRQQEANFRAFSRTLSNINIDDISEKWEFEDALKSLEARWSTIDKLHWQIDSELNGKDLLYEVTFYRHEKEFNTLKKEINKKMWSVNYREKSTPKLEIPIFSGNYNNWVSFKDLFTDAIHNNSTMPNSQKMQILKTKVKGEAERLIQHLYISSENYISCWEILNHRYNNKKLIFTSHMNILFSLPSVQYNSLAQIKKMHDVTLETLNAVKNLGVDTKTWDPIIVHLLSQKLDTETYTEYLESVKSPRELPVLQELLLFLEGKFTTLETSSRRKQEVSSTISHKSNHQNFSNNKKPFHSNNNPKYTGNSQVAKSYNVTTITCPLCKNQHGLYNCKTFLQMPNEKRLNTVKKLSLCMNCLYSHKGKPCNSSYTCRKCTEPHNTLIHDALLAAKTSSTSGQSNATASQKHATITPQDSNGSEILLATAQMKVKGADGTLHSMRALIDQGSQLSIITERGAQILGMKRQNCRGVIYGIGQRENNCKGKINITCTSLYNDYSFNTEVVIMTNLIKSLPNKTFSKPNWSNIQNINLADPDFYISRPVDILLGADIYSNILLSGIIRGDNISQPIAQQTQLGWLLCGNAQTFHCNVIINNIEDIQHFWETEEISEDGEMSSEEIQCVKYFTETTNRDEEGRYEVRIPMKQSFQDKLGTSKNRAIAQFLNLERKLQKQEKIGTSYRSFMNEYEQLKHMTRADGNTTLECYLPHHGVVRAESTTTKHRVVFNASDPTSTGCSLNDLMCKGPNLQQDLQDLILKWRQYRYAFTADIEKMYRQILVNRKDTPLQKIIWRESPQQPLQTYELLTVTYGTKAAPFLAMMTLKRLADDERDSFPSAAKVLEDSFYMDDLVHGAHNIDQGQKLISDLCLLLKSGGFNLRKWSANNQQLLENVTGQDKDDMVFNFKADNTSFKTLGLCWNPAEDTFTFQCQTKNITKLTKRTLLGEISKIFDPLGWLAPVVTKLKLLFQKVWKNNMKWDDEVSDDIHKEWSKLQADLPNINNYKVQRWILTCEYDVIELHGFCDASMEAYACVVYARVKAQTKVTLIAAKTKLVPLNKTLSMPRLELCGAHLLSKLMAKIKQTLSEHNIKTYGWIDSKVALSWLQGEPNQWKPFVANRVQQITGVMPADQWRYVNTAENPADAASRGLYPSQLLEKQSLWKEGPVWLPTIEPEQLPNHTFTTEQEAKPIKQSNAALKSNDENNIINQLIEKHSSFDKIVRILAWIQRAITPTNKVQRPHHLTLHELQKAKLTIVKYIQNDEYRTEMEHLRKHNKLESKCNLIALNPFIDSDQVLRVGGRLAKTTLNMEMKHPKIIPSKSRLATLLIDQAHKQTFHGGPRLTLTKLRQEYWITGGNNTVKKELRKCVTCRKHEGRKQEQLMGDLPAVRATPASPFYHTGVDYTGFMDIKANKGRGIKTFKGYVAVFVCMVTKAVHLELVSDLTSSAFLAALRRMSARRGAPRHLYSDNGTNFVGANNILQEEWRQLQHIFSDSFQAEVAEMNIEWHFNPPANPSAGGLWERAVRSLKHHLKRVVGEQKLTFEEYSTILAQLEACLNSRPLCALTENIEDLDFLTPAHFLTGRAGVTVMETEEDARTRWYLAQKIFQDIWKRWKTEYLCQLSSRGKWQHPQTNIKVGDLVVIHDDNIPSGKWAMGRVIEVHPGSDRLVRVVTLKTKNGTMKRPITKLSVLPLEQTAEQANQTERKPTPIQTKQKRTAKRSCFTTMIMTFLYFISIILTADCFDVKSLDSKQSLYFDQLAQMQIIRDNWKIVAYYDVSPYWEGNVAFGKYFDHLEKVCETLQQQTHCDIIIEQLRHSFNELQHYNRVLLQSENPESPRRRRRGLINGVGYLANTLFGVLDDKFAEQYTKDITLVRENQKHLANLWKNQTSVIEAEYNLLKRTEETVRTQHKIIIHINIEKMEDNTTDNSQSQLHKEIEEKLKTMKDTTVLSEDMSVHDVHHYTLIYVLWGVAIIAAAVHMGRRLRNRVQARAAQDESAGAAAAEPRGGPRPRAPLRNIESSEQVPKSELSDSVNSVSERGTSPVYRSTTLGGPL